uniref:uncharacterized protein LOC125906722 n=1 Tax=Anopheles coluzzii TaxID=1518534 RepID=UPI0020FFA27A|nr:uncharacterized protein LOC125906722 [Anopheles coluzzii]
MAAICFSCAEPLEATGCIISCAYCDATFHRGCCKLPPELIDAVLSNVDLHWSCIGCTNMLKNPRCRSVKEIGAQVGFQAALNSAVAAIGKLVEPIVAEVRSGFTLLQTASTPHNRNSDPRPATGRKWRRIIEDSASPGVNKIVNSRGNILCATSSPNAYTNTTIAVQPAPTQPHELVGTDPLSSPLQAAPREPFTDRIWIRLSRLSTAVTVEQVVASVKRRLATDDVTAYCLLRREVIVDSMNWLSFKVIVPAILRDTALTPSTWPVGIGVREFFQSRQHDHQTSSPIATRNRFTTRTPATSTEHRYTTRTPTTTHRLAARTSTPPGPETTSSQQCHPPVNDTLEAPNSTLVSGPSQNHRASSPHLHQSTIDRFFLN